MATNIKSSGVSIALNAITTSIENGLPLLEKKMPPQFTIKIASTLAEREAVFSMGYQIYLEKGFIKPNSQNWMVQNYDFDEDSVILMVQDQDKNLAGSLTMVFDGYSKLPAEKIYSKELKDLRDSGARMVELSRLIVNPEYRNSKEILVLLFNYLAIYSYHIKNYTSLVVEVNPRHKDYYKALLSFDEIGKEKACPMVQNAPAVLLHLPLKRYQSEVIRCKSQNFVDRKERSLYSFFLKPEQESLVAYYLQKQATPMNPEEKQYFGYSESNCQMADTH
jgi:hypothetical protein